MARGPARTSNCRKTQAAACVTSVSCRFLGQDRTGRELLPESKRSCGGWRFPSALHLFVMSQARSCSLAALEAGPEASSSDKQNAQNPAKPKAREFAAGLQTPEH